MKLKTLERKESCEEPIYLSLKREEDGFSIVVCDRGGKLWERFKKGGKINEKKS